MLLFDRAEGELSIGTKIISWFDILLLIITQLHNNDKLLSYERTFHFHHSKTEKIEVQIYYEQVHRYHIK